MPVKLVSLYMNSLPFVLLHDNLRAVYKHPKGAICEVNVKQKVLLSVISCQYFCCLKETSENLMVEFWC